MTEDAEDPKGGRPDFEREVLRRLGPAGLAPYTTWIPGPTTGDFTTWTRPGPGAATTGDFTTWTRPGPAAHPTITTVADAEGGLKPGRYKVETRQVTEFDVLESGHVVVRRDETQAGEPEPRDE